MENKKSNRATSIRWHKLLGRMLEELLTPLNITVLTDISVMTDPPEADILLIRRDLPKWTYDQLCRLPDGIRDTGANHILVEFKFTESFNRNTLNQALAYDTFFRRSQQSLKEKDIQTFVLCSKTPLKASREEFGYTEIYKSAIYHSTNPMLDRLFLIVINELSDATHNDFVRCFSSRKTKRWHAFKRIIKSGSQRISIAFLYFISGIIKLMSSREKESFIMEQQEITPDVVMEIGKELYEAMLDGLSIDDFMERFSAEEVLSRYKPEAVLSRYKPEERLSGLKPEERLSGLSLKEIEAYLKKMKNQKEN
ncbi:hypothetical protein [Desulfamplus magnetovallimortis]|nr:hypothetical protein [Desulfamplus magnetovallimortis]